jgi:hypothetical protein
MSKIIKGNKQNYSSSGKSRSISRIVNSVQTAEGEGFLVNRALFADFYPAFGEDVPGTPVLSRVKALAENVNGTVVPLSGHWIPEEQPEFVIEQLARFFSEI